MAVGVVSSVMPEIFVKTIHLSNHSPLVGSKHPVEGSEQALTHPLQVDAPYRRC